MSKVRIRTLLSQTTATTVYIGLDVHRRTWSVSFYLGEHYISTKSFAPHARDVIRYVERMFPGLSYQSVYEAGFCGFGLHRALCAADVQNIVVHPADIPTSDKEKQRKTDKVDSKKLARTLMQGLLEGIALPSVNDESYRGLVRCRAAHVKDVTRCKNRITQFLLRNGVEIPAALNANRWTKRYRHWLEHGLVLPTQAQHFERASLLRSYDRLVEEVRRIEEDLAVLERQDASMRATLATLQTMPGIGQTVSRVLRAELFDIERFATLDHLASYVGLAPMSRSSGDRQGQARLCHRGNHRIRVILIEAAWVAIRHDASLARRYARLKATRPPQVAIIHIAKALLGRLRAVWLSGQSYTCQKHEQPKRAEKTHTAGAQNSAAMKQAG